MTDFGVTFRRLMKAYLRHLEEAIEGALILGESLVLLEVS